MRKGDVIRLNYSRVGQSTIAVLTVNGDRFRAVEVKPARLPYEATPLEQKIIAATLSTKAWAERQHVSRHKSRLAT